MDVWRTLKVEQRELVIAALRSLAGQLEERAQEAKRQGLNFHHAHIADDAVAFYSAMQELGWSPVLRAWEPPPRWPRSEAPRGLLRVAALPGKGRGLLANRDLAAGEVVEVSPVLVLPATDADAVEQTVLDTYVFRWGPHLDELALALGLGSLFNHSYTPSAVYTRDFVNNCLVFTTLHDVKAGAEVTVNYNGDPACKDAVWFDVLEEP